MSRVAKNPVKLPAGVEIKLAGQQLSVKGAKGTLEPVSYTHLTLPTNREV